MTTNQTSHYFVMDADNARSLMELNANTMDVAYFMSQYTVNEQIKIAAQDGASNCSIQLKPTDALKYEKYNGDDYLADILSVLRSKGYTVAIIHWPVKRIAIDISW